MTDAFEKAVARNRLVEKYEKKIAAKDKTIATLTNQVKKLKYFIASQGMGEEFVEFVKAMAPKSIRKMLDEKQKMIGEQKRMEQRKPMTKKKDYNRNVIV